MTVARSDRVAAGGAARATIHANALLLGAAGVLLRGASGSGKSSLTLDLIAYAKLRGEFARLIGDDRIELVNRNGRLIARPHPAIAGAIEARGVGIIEAPHEPAGVIRLVVDLLREGRSLPERYPQDDALETLLCGIALPRLVADASAASASREIFSFIHQLVSK